MLLKSEEITKISGQQFTKLSEKEIKWYCYIYEFIQNIELFSKETSVVITNFKLQNELTKLKFSFEILINTDKTDEPIKVIGSIIENKTILNLIAHVSVNSNSNKESKKLTYHTTIFYREDCINDYLSLIESSFISLKHTYIINNPAIIKIKTTPLILKKIKVPIENDFYQLYKDKKIDHFTFCNLILAQPKINFKSQSNNLKIKNLNPQRKK